MNNLEETLEKILLRSLEVAEQTGQFVMDQAPDLVQQFFAWHIAVAWFWILLGIGLIILGILLPLTWRASKENQKHWYCNRILWSYYRESTNADVAASLVTLCGAFIGILIIGINLYNLIYITIAPKLYLIDYFLKVS